MPARDGTGPRGLGSQTGRGLGNCAPGTSNNKLGSGNSANLLGIGVQILGALAGSLRRRGSGLRQNRLKK